MLPLGLRHSQHAIRDGNIFKRGLFQLLLPRAYPLLPWMGNTPKEVCHPYFPNGCWGSLAPETSMTGWHAAGHRRCGSGHVRTRSDPATTGDRGCSMASGSTAERRSGSATSTRSDQRRRSVPTGRSERCECLRMRGLRPLDRIWVVKQDGDVPPRAARRRRASHHPVDRLAVAGRGVVPVEFDVVDGVAAGELVAVGGGGLEVEREVGL